MARSIRLGSSVMMGILSVVMVAVFSAQSSMILMNTVVMVLLIPVRSVMMVTMILEMAAARYAQTRIPIITVAMARSTTVKTVMTAIM